MRSATATVIEGLQVTPDGRLVLPRDVITQTMAILAIRGAGKSNAAAVFVEKMYAAGLPFLVVDPKGDWWGIRSSVDGTGPGLPIAVLGGLHGDIALTPESGQMVAELIVEHNLTCIVDVSDFPSDAAQMRFLTDFGRALFRLHRANPTPRHVVLEEADDIVPQTVRADQAPCVGIWTKMIKQGRAFGIGMTLISQRSAAVNKNALSQIETLIALRTTDTRDRKAIADWVAQHDAGGELVASLAGLEDGEAWVISPQWLARRHGQPPVQRIRFRQRETFDSGATPVMTAAPRKPAALASVDLGQLAERMAAVAEQAEQADPALLRRKVGALRGQVDRLTRELEAARQAPPRVEHVPVVLAADLEAAARLAAELGGHVKTLTDAIGGTPPPPPAPAPPAAPAAPPPRAPRLRPAAPAKPPAPAPAAQDGAPRLGKAERAILTVLAQNPGGLTRLQIGLLAGYSVKSSSLSNAIGALRGAGMITSAGTDPIRILPAGIAEAGDVPPTPDGPELVAYWLSRLGLAERTILQVFLDAWPGPLDKATTADRSGYSATSSSFSNALGRLRSLGLVDGWTAGETLATAARTEPARG
jgi:hypothetical protein